MPPEFESEMPQRDAHLENASPVVRYLNRELSLLAFQRRVLDEACNLRHPLLERVKFLAILGSNVDEFIMVRLAGLKHQVEVGVMEEGPDGLAPGASLQMARSQVLALLAEARTYLDEQILPALAAEGIDLLDYASLGSADREAIDAAFAERIFPVLTPLAIDPSHPFPHISSRSVNLAVILEDADGEERFARVKVPQTLPRFLRLPGDGERFVWLEDVVAGNLGALFPGVRIREFFTFRVVRDADLEIQEDEAEDLLETIEQSVRQRWFGDVVCLLLPPEMPAHLEALLVENLEIGPADVWRVEGRMALHGLMEIASLDRRALRDPPFVPVIPPALAGEDLFAALRKHDILLHHPFDSFDPVVDFIDRAAVDPDVLAIKQTLYRVGRKSPIVRALMRAREEGKQVAVLVELKARFDEENNIEWARALERAGVHVVYGLIGLKTHSKVALVVRREADGIRRYVHVGTGNYNRTTAQTYTDLGLLSADPALGADATHLFNALTGYSAQRDYRKMLVAPFGLRNRLVEAIDREITFGDLGHIILKTNSLVDPAIIEKLYEASQAGVKVELLVRGICCLRPRVPGLSDNVRVVSVVGRFLEHSRIFYFRNGGQELYLVGSADLMRRNLDRRVEVVIPIEDPPLRAYLRDVLAAYLRDQANASELQADGSYVHRSAADGEEPFDAQDWLLHRHQEMRVPGTWAPAIVR